MALSLHGPAGSRRTLKRIVASIHLVPDGYVAVPYLGFGTSSDEGVQLLEVAGLLAELPDVNFPHYVVGTTPGAGAVVREGTQVKIQVGDG